MSKVMLVNVTHVEESRVATLDDGLLQQYEIETASRAHLKGNIHNAVVENIHPALDAAFLRIGPDLKGFLPLDEVNFRLLPSRSDSRKHGRIGQHLHAGQKLMVQVVREPFAGKPPTVTTYFSLPGRYLVLMPGVDSSGVSRKIENSDQRDKLKKMVEELSPPEGFGVIVRTAGVGQNKTELQRDLRYLLRLWESIQRASRGTDFPGLVYRERDLVIRTIRDHFTHDIDEVWIDNPDTHDRALEFVRDVMPTKAKNVKLYTGDRPLFSKFNLEEQIESIYKRRVPLRSGGEIVIDGTEALTAIDVNSKGAPRQGDAEENALATNLEAASEIARQMRLRDLGGLIVIDFIDMMASRNQKKVEKVMRDAMKNDRAKHDIVRISKLGLMEMARQRLRAEKMQATYAACPVCEGYGLVKNVESAGLAALRKLQARCLRADFGKVRMGVPPEIAQWLLNFKREEIVSLERRHGIKVVVEPKGSLLRHESEFEFFPRDKVEVPPALVLPDRQAPPAPPDMKELEQAPPEEPDGTEPAADGPEPAEEPAPARKRRRRRRRGRGRDAAPAEGGAPAVEGTEPEDEGTDADLPVPETDTDAEAPETEAAAGAPETEGARKRRRRRRRRRRGAGAGEPGAEAAPAGQTDAEPPEVVPNSVRSDELMPAATGGRSRRGRNRG
jgi:ribonuclease E